MRLLSATLIGLSLVAATTSLAQTPPDWRQTLGGLLSGNQDRDDALRQAYERGYKRGRDDEARISQRREPRDSSYERGGYYSR
ncbi:MAG TPA: hypothetical protein VKY24_00825 [Reyranella sp.]|nr:hypothetical protein [Reyranella sp.]